MDKTKSTQFASWKVSTKRFVGYIDIMGFKDMVSRSTHQEIYELMMKIDEGKLIAEDAPWTNRKIKRVRTTSFSDSIMIYSKDDNYESFNSFIIAVSGLTDDLLRAGIPHKGAVAYGTMTLDSVREIYFGQPLIDAYLLQEEIYFYGIVVHGTVEQVIDTKFAGYDVFIKKYLCPFKNSSSNHLTVYPMYAELGANNTYKKENLALFESINKFKYMTSGHLRKYVDNTESYLTFIRDSIKTKK
jgi:hypothetical protein